MPEGDAQTHGVESALAKVADVAFKLTEVHLLRLLVFLHEVAWLFVNLGKRCAAKLVVPDDIRATHIARPAILHDPAAGGVVPSRAARKDAPGQGKAGRIEFEYRQVCELFAVSIEELVIEDAARFSRMRMSKNPVVFGVKKRLRRLALDRAAQGFLAAICLWQIGLVEEKQADRHQGRDADDRYDKPVQADSGCLHGHDFAVAVQDTEGD